MLRPVRRFFRTPKGLLTIVLAVLTALAAPSEGLRLVWPQLLGAVGVAVATDVVKASAQAYLNAVNRFLANGNGKKASVQM